jgi:hypothetical protein
LHEKLLPTFQTSPPPNLLYYEIMHLLGDNIETHCVFIFLKKLGFAFQKVHQVTSFKSFVNNKYKQMV